MIRQALTICSFPSTPLPSPITTPPTSTMPAAHTAHASVSVDHIQSSHIIPLDLEGWPMETTAHAWPHYNYHLFWEEHGVWTNPYPPVNTVYACSATDCVGDNMLEDLFLDVMYVVVELLHLLGQTNSSSTGSKQTSRLAAIVLLRTSMFCRTLGSVGAWSPGVIRLGGEC